MANLAMSRRSSHWRTLKVYGPLSIFWGLEMVVIQYAVCANFRVLVPWAPRLFIILISRVSSVLAILTQVFSFQLVVGVFTRNGKIGLYFLFSPENMNPGNTYYYFTTLLCPDGFWAVLGWPAVKYTCKKQNKTKQAPPPPQGQRTERTLVPVRLGPLTQCPEQATDCFIFAAH